jgi:hypothetical protein
MMAPISQPSWLESTRQTAMVTGRDVVVDED